MKIWKSKHLCKYLSNNFQFSSKQYWDRYRLIFKTSANNKGIACASGRGYINYKFPILTSRVFLQALSRLFPKIHFRAFSKTHFYGKEVMENWPKNNLCTRTLSTKFFRLHFPVTQKNGPKILIENAFSRLFLSSKKLHWIFHCNIDIRTRLWLSIRLDS